MNKRSIHLLLEDNKVYEKDYLIHTHQEIPAWLLRLPSWGRRKLQLGQVLTFAAVVLNTSDCIWGLLFLFNSMTMNSLRSAQVKICYQMSSLPQNLIFRAFLGFRIASKGW